MAWRFSADVGFPWAKRAASPSCTTRARPRKNRSSSIATIPGRARASASRKGITAQFPPAYLHNSQAARPRRGRAARQRPLRRWRRRMPARSAFQMRATNLHGPGRQTIRRALLKQVDVHTLLRLRTGILTPRFPARRPLGHSLILRSQRIQVYAQGVKANVLFFDRKSAQEKPWSASRTGI